MFDFILKNKDLSQLAIVAMLFYAYTSYQNAQKTALEIELLKQELDAQKSNNVGCI